MTPKYTRLAPSDEVTQTSETDTFCFVFSNESKGRDGHVVRNAGIQTDNYQRNPVVLWSHDDTQPPIGRGENIDTSGINCRVDVTFTPEDINPFGATIGKLVRGKWLRALSMSWQPIKYRKLNDNSGGMDFLEVDLLEISVVPLPALADALMDARRYVDVTPLRSWASMALESRTYRGATRPTLEAIHRALSGSVTSLPPRSRDLGNSTPRDDYGRAELRRFEAAASRKERERRAQIIKARGKSGLTDWGQQQLETAQKEHERTFKHHRAVSKHHASMDESIDKLRAVRRKITSTLSGLGIEDRALDVSLQAFADHLDDLKTDAESAMDFHEQGGSAVKRAERCVRSVLTGAEQSEPLDDESDSKEHDSVEDRAARARRIKAKR